MNPKLWCSSSEHNVFSEFYDGRMELIGEYGNSADYRCRVCGFEYTQMHQRVINLEREYEKELSHVRSGARYFPQTS